jgi:hypothetical protein
MPESLFGLALVVGLAGGFGMLVNVPKEIMILPSIYWVLNFTTV